MFMVLLSLSTQITGHYRNLRHNRLLPGLHKSLHIHRPTTTLHTVSLLCSLRGRKGIFYTTTMYFQDLTEDTRVRSQANHFQICGGQSSTAIGVCPNTSDFSCQYHSTNAPYPIIHLPPTLYNVSHPVLQFSPVSTIPPMLHTDLHLSPTLHLFKLNG